MRFLSFALICAYGCLAQPFKSLDQVIAATPKYNLAITVLPDSHAMFVSGDLRLPAQDKEQDAVELNLSRLMTQVEMEIVEPAASAGAMMVTEDPKQDKSERTVRWILRPKLPIAPHQPVRIRFSYLGGSHSMVFYLGPEGSFAGGSNTVWYPQADGNARGCGHLKFTVPPGDVVLATGKDLSAPDAAAQGHFEFEDGVPSQFSFAAGKYTIYKRDGIVPMRAYLLHPRSNVDSYLDGCSHVLALLSRKFGKYPFPQFAIAEVPSEQANSNGFSGASMNSFILADKESLDQPFNLAYYGHEISHQWWGNLVTNGSKHGDYMLDEAMAQFGSLYAVGAIDGRVAAEEYRRTGYPGYSAFQCGYGYLRKAESGTDQPLGNLSGGYAHELADSKGFLVWDLLARTIGPERFDTVLRTITRNYACQQVNWEEFLFAIQRASGKDLSWFYSQWFERMGAPDWQVTWKQTAGSVSGEVSQVAPAYRAILDAEIQGVNGESITHTLEVDGEHTEFHWPAAFRVRAVVLDPHFRVLHWLPELRAEALARGPALRADYLCDTGALDEAEASLRKTLDQIPRPDSYGARFSAEFVLAKVFIKRKNWHEAETHLDAALMSPSRDTANLQWLYYDYAKVAQALKDDAKLRWAVDATAGTDAYIYAQALLPEKHP